MALCSLPSSRFILHSANALVFVSVKVKEASQFPDIKIVNFDWLISTVNSQVRADEAQFSFDQTGSSQYAARNSMSPTPSKKNTKGKSRKRPRSPTPVESDPFDVDKPAESSPTKRHKDVQTAKSNSLLIPVDETCPLAGNTFNREPFFVEAIPTDGDRNASSIHRRRRNDLRCSVKPNKRRTK